MSTMLTPIGARGSVNIVDTMDGDTSGWREDA
jgi:hypothetical protein